ncbi:hypothetical protein IAR55_000238 [Kwoniella newhampshirensis]|uniref:Peptidase S9 prolyl oligopeptidase catalytic domain-containing protein n=1 Tax=Kwoniella newhampshirensis TaxID=1651941 RepID=A0AAW0Z6N5_9TREE
MPLPDQSRTRQDSMIGYGQPVLDLATNGSSVKRKESVEQTTTWAKAMEGTDGTSERLQSREMDQQRVKIWYGDEDEKISERSMRWMERCLDDVELIVVPKEGHGLMTCANVMWDVLESLGKEARRR